MSRRYSRPLPLSAKCLLALCTLLLAFSASAQTVTGNGAVENFTYNGNRNRQYSVYIPRSYDGSTAVPMIFAVHGCVMDHRDALNLWNFDLIADQNNVIVVYPFVTSFSEQRSENCWGYWFDQHVKEGRGGEVDDLHGMGQEVESRYNIDPNRRYITGISSGGGLTVAAGIAYNDYWAAAAPAAGLPYGDTSTSAFTDTFQSVQFHVDKINSELNNDRPIPMLVIQSSNDTVVAPQAMDRIRDSQLTAFGADLSQDGPSEDCSAEGINCTMRTYNGTDGKPLVKTMLYDGLPAKSASLGNGHYWTGDDENQDKWAKEQGPSASQAAWAFFNTVTLDGTGSGGQCDDNNDTTAPATPTNLSATEVRDRFAVMSVDANSEADFNNYNVYVNGSSNGSSASNTITVSGLSAQTTYNVSVTAVDGCGNESAQSNVVSITTTVPEYVAPSATGTVNDHYLAGRIDVNQMLDLGGQYGYVDTFTMWQRQDGSWTDVNPNGTNPQDPDDPVDPEDPDNPVEPGQWTTERSLAGMEVHIYTPSGTTDNGQRALMITLHGCGQTNEEVRDGWGWQDEADQYGMVIAVPDAPNGGVLIGCWDYYDSNHNGSNPSRHDDNLIDLATTMVANSSWNIDADQVYISGLSSGATEAANVGCMRPDIFAGIGVAAGPSIGTGSYETQNVPFGTTASSVRNLCEQYSADSTGFQTQVASFVIEAGTGSDGLAAKEYTNISAEAAGLLYGASKDSGSNSISGGGTEETWSDSEGPRVSKVAVSGLGHAWPAGRNSSGGGQYTDHRTIDYPAHLTAFLFDNNRRKSGPVQTPTPTPTPVVTPTPATPTPTPVVTPTPTTPTPTPVVTPAPVTPTPVVTPVITPTPAPECEEVTTYNYYHKVGGRAYSSGSYFTPNYFANGSDQPMSGSTWGNTTLRSSDGTYWEVGGC